MQSDPSEFKKAAKALSDWSRSSEVPRVQGRRRADIAGAEELAKGSDADMRELAEEELTTLTARSATRSCRT